jgi:hypothetical protein
VTAAEVPQVRPRWVTQPGLHPDTVRLVRGNHSDFPSTVQTWLVDEVSLKYVSQEGNT